MEETPCCLAGRFFFSYLGSASLAVHHFLEWRMLFEAERADHLDGIFVGEDGEVGLGVEDDDVAALAVLADALDAVAGHGNLAFAVGEGEEFVAGTRGHEVVVLLGDELGAVAEEEAGLGFALGGEAGDVVNGDELRLGRGEKYLAVVHDAEVPVFLDGEGAVLVVFVIAVLEAAAIGSLAVELAVVVVGHEAALEGTVDVVGGDVALLAEAFPPAAVAVVVGPVGHLDGVSVGLEDDVGTVLDTHLVGGFLHQVAVFGVEAPESVAVALVVFAAGEEAALLVVGFVEALLAGNGVGVADAHGAVVVVVGEGASLEAVDEVALVDFGAVLVGANPVALAAPLLVDLVLGCGADGGEHHGSGENEECFFHGLQKVYYCYCIIFI